MADVTSYTKDGVDALVAGAVVGADITSDTLTLHTKDGTDIPIGSVGGDTPNATESVYGLVTISSAADVSTGTEDTSAVSPLKLKTVTTALSAATSAVATTAAAKLNNVQLFGGSSYAPAPTANVYVGGTPSGTIPNGSIWFDTTA
jgi:hypothetical protein